MALDPKVLNVLKRELRVHKVVPVKSTFDGIKGLSGDKCAAVLMPNVNGHTLLGVCPEFIDGAPQNMPVDFFLLAMKDPSNIQVLRPPSKPSSRSNCGNSISFCYDSSASRYLCYCHTNGVYQLSTFNSVVPHGNWHKCAAEFYELKLFREPPAEDTAKLHREWQELLTFIRDWVPSGIAVGIRIGIFGRMRIGKSSLLHSIASALAQDVFYPEKVVDGAQRGTVKYFNTLFHNFNKYIEFATNEGFESNSINAQYIQRVLRICEGSEPVGADMEFRGLQGLVPDYQRKPLNAIIHVLSESVQQTDFQMAREINKELEVRGFDPSNHAYYAISQVDMLQVDGAETVTEYLESDVLRSKVKAVKDAMTPWCLGTTNIFPVIAIGKWMDRTHAPQIDPHTAVLVLRMLKRILVTYSNMPQLSAVGPQQGTPTPTPQTANTGYTNPAPGPGTGTNPSTTTPPIVTQVVGQEEAFYVQFKLDGSDEVIEVLHRCQKSPQGLKLLESSIEALIKEKYTVSPAFKLKRLQVEKGPPANIKVTLSRDDIEPGALIYATVEG